MNKDYVKPKGELLPVVATRSNYEGCNYKILSFQAQVAINIENKPSRAIPGRKLQTTGKPDSPLDGVNLCTSTESWNVLQEESKKAMTPGQRW